MYKLTIKDSVYTIPKQNLKLLAMSKALDLHLMVDLSTNEKVIEFFNSIGITVEEVK